MSEQTRGRLRIVDERDEEFAGSVIVQDGTGNMVADCNIFGPLSEEVCLANARRLVACWNACEGIGTEALEATLVSDIDEMGAQAINDRSELIGALQMAEGWLRPSGASKGHKEGWAIKEDHDRIVALLAKHGKKP